MTGDEANGQAAFLRRPGVSLLREGIRFVFADASGVARKRIADAVNERKERAGGGEAGRGEGRKEMQKECHSLSQSRRNFARLERNWWTEK